MRPPPCAWLCLAVLFAACGDGAETPGDAAAATPVCGPDQEQPDWSPIEGAAVVVTHAHGIPSDAEIWIDGAQRFRGPYPCVVQVPPGAYRVRYVAAGTELASLDLTVAGLDVHVVGLLQHPTLGPLIAAVPWDFTPPADGQWRLQLANYSPESATTPLEVHAFPPGTPSNPVPRDAVPTLLGTMARGGQLTALLPHDTQVLSLVPQGSSYTPQQAPSSLLREPCAAQLGVVLQVWCDSADPYDDEGGPCDGVLGGHIWMHSLNGVGCFDG